MSQEPETSKISIRTSISSIVGRKKEMQCKVIFHECPVLFGNRTSKNLSVLVQKCRSP